MIGDAGIAGATVGAALLAYMIVSVVLLRHPHWMHGRAGAAGDDDDDDDEYAPGTTYTEKLRRPLRSFPLTHGSHRGGAGEQPENTLRAFDHAVGALVAALPA